MHRARKSSHLDWNVDPAIGDQLLYIYIYTHKHAHIAIDSVSLPVRGGRWQFHRDGTYSSSRGQFSSVPAIIEPATDRFSSIIDDSLDGTQMDSANHFDEQCTIRDAASFFLVVQLNRRSSESR